MPTIKTSREDILRSCWALFHERGYKNTSVQQLADAAGLGKAGLLHHFGSKVGLMKAVLDFAVNWYEARLTKIAARPGDPAVRLAAVLQQQFELVQLNGGGGCFFGNMILETGAGDPFANLLKQFHEIWTRVVGAILAERYGAAEAERRAYRLFVDYQGSVMLYKLYGDPTHLTEFRERTLRSLDHPLP